MYGVDRVAPDEASRPLGLGSRFRDVGLLFLAKHHNTLFLFSWKIYSNIILLMHNFNKNIDLIPSS